MSHDIGQMVRKPMTNGTEAPDLASMSKSEVRPFISLPFTGESMAPEADSNRVIARTCCPRRNFDDKRIQVPKIVGCPGNPLHPPAHNRIHPPTSLREA